MQPWWCPVVSDDGLAFAVEYRLWYRQAASGWLEALPLGNGSLGAMLWGGVAQERADLNVDTLWSGCPRRVVDENRAGVLDALRSAVLERQDYVEADALALRLQGSFNESYQPVGSITADFEDIGEVEGYARSLDLKTAVASVRYKAGGAVYERESFVSAPARALVMHWRVQGKRRLNATIGLATPHPSEGYCHEDGTAWLEGRVPTHVAPDYWDEEPAVVYGPGPALAFAVVFGLSTDGGRVHRSPAGRVQVEDARSVTVYVTAATTFSGWSGPPTANLASARSACRNALVALLEVPYEAIRARHVRDHAALFDRCRLQLAGRSMEDVPTDERLRAVRGGATDEGLCALLFHYGRYLLISSSRPGSQAANLQGIWNDRVRPPWSCNWTTNINVEMNYWHAETTNLAECHEPLLSLVSDLAAAGTKTAAELYGCRGWVCHHNVDIWRSSWPTGTQKAHPYWVNWQMAGPWLCQHLWEHYVFSEDRRFLERVYPVMRGAAQFVLDHLVPGPDGALVTCPSTSPENSFLTAGGAEAAVSAASSLDIWLIRDLFHHCVEASRVLGVNDGFVADIEATLARLYMPKVSSDGRLQEWWEDFGEPEPGHRHLSHLFCVYPGDEAAPELNPALAAAARRSLEHRLTNGSGGPGWSRAWVTGLWARLLDGQSAWESLWELLRKAFADNLFSSHDQTIFQIDANFGATAAIAEMLLQSHTGTLDVLPALPAAWHDGQVFGLRARGGLTIDMRWANNGLAELRIAVPSARVLKVQCGNRLRLGATCAGATKLLTTGEPSVITLEVPGPGVYTLVRADV